MAALNSATEENLPFKFENPDEETLLYDIEVSGEDYLSTETIHRAPALYDTTTAQWSGNGSWSSQMDILLGWRKEGKDGFIDKPRGSEYYSSYELWRMGLVGLYQTQMLGGGITSSEPGVTITENHVGLTFIEEEDTTMMCEIDVFGNVTFYGDHLSTGTITLY